MIDNLDKFYNKTILELGCGLGMVSIMLDKALDQYGLHSSSNDSNNTVIIATDGDEPTLQLLRQNIEDTGSKISCAKLYWDCKDDEDYLLSLYPEKYQVLLAADVIYEDGQVEPLFQSVGKLLRHDGIFILSYARRNIPIDKVFKVSCEFGYTHQILGENTLEPIYQFQYK